MTNDPQKSMSSPSHSLAKNNQAIIAFFAARKGLEAEIRGRYRYVVKFTHPADENLTLLEMCKYELLQEQALLNSPMATTEMLEKLPQIKADLYEVTYLLETRKILLAQIRRASSLLTRLKRWLTIAENPTVTSTITAIQIKNVGEMISSLDDGASSTQSITKTWELQVLNEANQSETSTISITTTLSRQDSPTEQEETKSKSVKRG